jgi:predicted dehydrogenase
MKRAANDRIRAGLIGVGNWARYGHIPALRSLKEQYEITAVSSRQMSRAEELAKGFGIPHAFGDHRQLIEHPDIDLVVVLPPASEHAPLSRLAIEAGKDVYCEWPLTTTTADSTHLLSMAETAKVRHAVGLQRRMGHSARYLRGLLAQGDIGTLRSVRMHVSIEYFGPQRPPSLEWSLPAVNFSHLLSIYGGHFFDLLFYIAGTPKTVGAITAVQFPTLTLARTGESFPNETPDAVLAQGRLAGDGLYSVQIEAGKHNNTGLQIDFTGTDGDLKVSNTKAFGNVSENLIEGARKDQKQLEVLAVPAEYQLIQTSSLDASVQDLVHLYTAFAHPNGETYQAPSFGDAVWMHRFIDAIRKASDTGVTQQLD